MCVCVCVCVCVHATTGAQARDSMQLLKVEGPTVDVAVAVPRPWKQVREREDGGGGD